MSVEQGSPVDVVVNHPRLKGLASTAREQERLERFAVDLARWLVGWPRERLGALARVVTVVARKELHTARQVSTDRPLLAVEGAARAVQALWPLLRGPDEPDVPEPPPPAPPGASPEPGDDGGDPADAPPGDATPPGGSSGPAVPGEGPPGSGPPGEPGEPDPDAPDEGSDGAEAAGSESGADDLDPLDVLQALAELEQVADPELDALAERLRERMGAGDAIDIAAEAGELLDEAGRAATDGALETDRVARHLERFLPGVGWSNAPGTLENGLLGQLDALTDLLADLADLDRLADALGRMEEPTREKGLIQGGREEVVGVTLSGEVALALPSELALLADPDTEDLFYQRMIEHRLISLELTGAGDHGESAGDARGPVIACIDTSGSMEGAPELAAKALVLAVCRRVLPRNRAVHLLLFGGPGERTEIRLRRGRGGLEALLGFLTMSFHSGTDFDGPLLRAMDLLEEQDLQRADVLVVTDGLGRASREVIERVLEVRDAKGARVWSVVLGRSDARGVEPFSHQVLVLDPRGAAEATGLLRGITR